MTPSTWSGTAFNQATESENLIHADDVARRYGFRGGLVPGVTVHAYLTQPAIVAWGLDWLTRGGARVVLRKPLYDGERFDVSVEDEQRPKDDAPSYRAVLSGEDGVPRADAEVWLAQKPPPPPTRAGAKVPPAFDQRPDATRAELERLQREGMGALRTNWSTKSELTHTSLDPDEMPDLVRQDRGGYASPAFTLGLANWVLSRNVRLGPWIHVQSDVQHHAPIALGDALVVEAQVTELFERKGNEFVDLELAAFRESDDAPVMSASHRAIYVLRERG